MWSNWRQVSAGSGGQSLKKYNRSDITDHHRSDMGPSKPRVAGSSPAGRTISEASILNAMKLLLLLAQRAGRELARHPEARGTADEVLAKAQRVLNDDIMPGAQQVWRDAQREIANAKRRLTRVAQDLRDEYRKGRDGE